MSGDCMNVLLVYPEFPETFWSFTSIRKMCGVKAMQPPLSLLTVAALLPSGWEPRLVDLNVRPLSKSDWQWADCVMVSAMFHQRSGLRRVVDEAKRRGKPTIAGGPYPSTAPDELLATGCDYVVKGEAENTMVILVNALAHGNGPRIIVAGEKPDLSTSPVPRFDLVCHRDYSSMVIQTSRGCPFQCEFCDIIELFGRSPRYKTAGQVVAELEAIRRTGYAGHVFIADDNFIGNPRNAREILKAMTEWNGNHGEPFGYTTQVSINLGQDPELVDLMTAANFGDVFIGLETTDVQALAGTGKTQNLKSPLAESVGNIQRNGLTVIGSFMLGFDEESSDVWLRICELVEQTAIPMAMINLLMAAPGTALWRRLEREGRLVETKTMPDTTCSEFNFRTQRPEAEVLEDCARLWERLYEPSNYLDRAFRYYTGMRPTRRAIAVAAGQTTPKAAARQFDVTRLARDLRPLLHILWRQGVVSRCRVQFWRQLVMVMRMNPSRLKLYLAVCVMGEWLFEMRDRLSIRMRAMAAEYRSRGLHHASKAMPGQQPG